MVRDDETFLTEFYTKLMEEALTFKDGQPSSSYVPLYARGDLRLHDPVQLLSRVIRLSRRQRCSAQLFSGFRGSGKSTELRRLESHLTAAGYAVVLIDIEDYLDLSHPMKLGEFMMALVLALGERLSQQHLRQNPVEQGPLKRFLEFLGSDVKLEEGSFFGIKLRLRSSPSFLSELLSRQRDSRGRFLREAHDAVRACAMAVRKALGDATELVVLVDSLEHLRATTATADSLYDAMQTLFVTDAQELQLPEVHVLYTVPPFLKALHPGIGRHYPSGGLLMLPSIKTRDRQGGRHAEGCDALLSVITARGDWQRLLGPDRAQVDRMADLSGGHLRDFLRLFAEIIRQTDTVPASPEVIAQAVSRVRSEFLPIADADAMWLAQIDRTRRAHLPERGRLSDLAHFLDTHLVLCYLNGEEWYAVHPLVVDEVRRIAAEMAPP